ncbi:MFS family permease [Spinactinospora alkalitolerans]|uniref:MFS family permease n=1 Tax=Spinactinospora alkalitolerans TaxID=687207 RepID=A0A852U2T6_9ACTN|nr:MFS transporter [Spinactinospora alkalitolerans]NYE48454.1 MFS family permease [Spinactinospora alkalitolerans]
MAPASSDTLGTDTSLAVLQRRPLTTVAVSQILDGAGLAAGVTVGALLAQDMLGTSSLSGLPAALFTLGSAAAAFLVGRISQRLGRRTGLVLGYAAGAAGGAGVVAAAVGPQTRARTQGAVDVCVALAGVSGGILSGMVVAARGFAALSIGGGLLALAILPFVAWSARRRAAA